MPSTRARQRVAAILGRTRVPLLIVQRLRERALARKAPAASANGADGLPLPPADLRVLVDGHADPDSFIRDSAACATAVRGTLEQSGIDMTSLGRILDFGCGCGRVARHWANLRGPELHGCDYNPRLVQWCSENLPFMTVVRNSLEPPAPYEGDRFDLVYAVSIFTHLTEPLQHAWITEYARILKPGGLLLLTTHGDGFRHLLSPTELAEYDAGQLVVQRPYVEGTNACTAYHPYPYVERALLGDFTVLSFTPNSRGDAFPQDVYLARLEASDGRPTG